MQADGTLGQGLPYIPRSTAGKRGTASARRVRTVGAESGLVGKCPVATVNLEGVDVSALVDTGSEISTITQSWVNANVPDAKLQSTTWKLTAANGLSIPYVGLLEVWTEIYGMQMRGTFSVVKDTVPPQQYQVILGMNLLQQMAPNADRLPQPLQTFVRQMRVDREVIGLVRVAGRQALPANSVCALRVVGGRGIDTVAEPCAHTLPNGLVIVPTLIKRHYSYIRVANLTDDPIILQNRTPVATLREAAVESPTLEFHVRQQEVHVSLAPQPAADPSLLDKLPPMGRSPEEQDAVRQLLLRYPSMLPTDDMDMGHSTHGTHRIPITKDSPLSQRHRPIPPRDFQDVRKHIGDL